MNFKKSKRRVHTFSSIYKDRDCNEERFVRSVNNKWNTISHYTIPEDDKTILNKHIDRIIWHHDEPTKGASLYSQYKVMQTVADSVKVVLDGQGADEFFAEYVRYYSYHIDDVNRSDRFMGRIKAIKLLTIFANEWPEHKGTIATDVVATVLGLDNERIFHDKSSINRMEIQRSEPLFTKQF